MTARTEKIFEVEPYTSSFFAKVTATNGDWVALDRTAFYPGGGGQDPDVGSLNGMKVVEVRYKDGEIAHKVPGNDLSIGQSVEGCVDFERRLDLMRGHTGEHLLFSALNRAVPDLELVKIAITPAKKSFIVKGMLDLTMVLEAERFVNEVIWRGVGTTEETVGRDDPLIADARVKLDRIPGDRIRLVRIGEYDLAACAGVHVRNTSEIGMLLVEKLTSARPQGDFEIEFSVGKAAVDKALQYSIIAMRASETLGAQPEDVISALENQRKELEVARDSMRALARTSIEKLEPGLVGNVPFYRMVSHGLDRKTLSEEATKKVQDGRSLCVLVDAGEKMTIVVAAGKDSGFDANVLLKKCLEQIGGKGGGNSTFATGGGTTTSSGEEVMKVVVKTVDETNV